MSRRLRAAVLLVMLLLAGAAPAQEPPRRSALDWPAIDGASAASLQLGQEEDAVLALFGAPDETLASPLAGRLLRYEILPHVRLEVHARAGRLEAIGFTVIDGQVPARSPRTVRGIELGAPMVWVAERYGPPVGGRHWYAEPGIAFNLESAADTVQSILIFAPGRLAP